MEHYNSIETYRALAYQGNDLYQCIFYGFL